MLSTFKKFEILLWITYHSFPSSLLQIVQTVFISLSVLGLVYEYVDCWYLVSSMMVGVANIWTFEYIQIFYNKYIHKSSTEYTQIFIQHLCGIPNIFGYSSAMFLNSKCIQIFIHKNLLTDNKLYITFVWH